MVKDRFCKPAAQATVGSIPTRGSKLSLTISLKVELLNDNRKAKERYLHGQPLFKESVTQLVE